MKFNITISQKIIKENNINIDIVDAAILDIIKEMPLSKGIDKKDEEGVIFFWINHANFARENPILGIKTADGIYRRLIKLCKLGLIHIHPDNQKNKRSYYAISEYYFGLFIGNKDYQYGRSSDVTSDEKPNATSDEKPKDYTISNDSLNINVELHSTDVISDSQTSLFNQSADSSKTDENSIKGGGREENFSGQDFVKMVNELLSKDGAERKFRYVDKIGSQLRSILKKGFSEDDIRKSVIAASKNDFHVKNNFKYLTPHFFLREDKLQMYLNQYEVDKNKYEPKPVSASGKSTLEEYYSFQDELYAQNSQK